MPIQRSRIFHAVIAALWVVVIAVGIFQLWKYESTPSVAGHSPVSWPVESTVNRSTDLPTLLVLVHPRCACSQATIGELAKLMTECEGKLATTVLVVRPTGFAPGWEKSDLWNSAAAIGGVTMLTDTDGIESRRFGVETSGEALLFSPDGQLLFAGGITESRGHMGDNAGRSTIAALVTGTHSTDHISATSVFGCSLFDQASPPPAKGKQAWYGN